MSRKLKIVSDDADIVPPPPIDFDPAPTRKHRAGWTADKQRKFIEHLALTGNAGEAAAVAGVASSSAYRLRDRAGAESFAREAARRDMPGLLEGLTDVPPDECAAKPIGFLDDRLGETGSGEPIDDAERG